MPPREILLDICVRGLNWLCVNPNIDGFLEAFWRPECQGMNETQRRNLLFVVYESAWRRAEDTTEQAYGADDHFEALTYYLRYRRYFEAFKSVGDYLILTSPRRSH